MKKHIWIINGSGGVGKDSFCGFVKDCSGYGTIIVSLVDKVKEIGEICGCNPNDKSEKNRKFLAELTDLLTDYNDLPMSYIDEKIKYFQSNITKDIMFIHARKPKDIERLKKNHPDKDIKTILVTNENVPHITSNSADSSVFDYKYDYYIKNDGTLDDLKTTALEFVERICR